MDSKPFVNNVDRLPINIVLGRGCKLQDDNGKWYFDLWGDEGVASLGYGARFNVALAQFIATQQPHRLPDMYPNNIRTEAATVLCRNFGYDRVFFCNSGAEVNEAMIKMARRYWTVVRDQPQRNFIVTIKGNFHGRSGFALAASDSSESPYHKLGFGPFPDGFGVLSEEEVIQAAQPKNLAEDHWVTPSENRAPFQPNDEAPGIPWAQVAAIHMAPVLGNNVVHCYSREFWDALETLRKHHGFLLCFDEVQVANGRTGYFAASMHPDIYVRPDIIGIGKGLALGLPAAALLTNDDIGSAFSAGTHFATFGGTVLVCYMMIELQKHLAGIGLEHVRAMEKVIRREFQSQAEYTPKWLSSFEGLGVHWSFTPDWESLGCDGFKFCQVARKFGLLLVTHRPYGCIRFTPPLVIQERELDEIFDALNNTADAIFKLK